MDDKVGLRLISTLFLNDKFSDVLLYGKENVPIVAHKLVLAASCEYFEQRLFQAQHSEPDSFQFIQTPTKIVEFVLNYFYTGQSDIDSLTDEDIVLLHLFCEELEFETLLHLTTNRLLTAEIKLHTLNEVFEIAKKDNSYVLLEKCYLFIDNHAEEIVENKELFVNFSQQLVSEIIVRDTFEAEELQLFLALKKWVEFNHYVESEHLFDNIRLGVIDVKDYATLIRPTKLVNDDAFFKAKDCNIHTRRKKPPRIEICATESVNDYDIRTEMPREQGISTSFHEGNSESPNDLYSTQIELNGDDDEAKSSVSSDRSQSFNSFAEDAQKMAIVTYNPRVENNLQSDFESKDVCRRSGEIYSPDEYKLVDLQYEDIISCLTIDNELLVPSLHVILESMPMMNEKQKSTLGTAGLIECLLGLISSCEENDEVFGLTLSLIKTCIVGCQPNTSRFLFADGIDIVLKCVKKNSSELLICNVVSVIAQISLQRYWRNQLMRNDCIKYLQKCLSLNTEISFKAAFALCCLSFEGESYWNTFQIETKRIDVLSSVSNAVKNWKTSIDVKFYDCNIINTILHFLRESDSAEIQYFVIWSVANLSQIMPETFYPLFIYINGIELLKKLKSSSGIAKNVKGLIKITVQKIERWSKVNFLNEPVPPNV